ncbi:MAG TPA: PaaI family thioesterase [Acidimicrobiales bacterium]|nr:PaaI family thioesterase [Acidimicrobiales bacterium]
MPEPDGSDDLELASLWHETPDDELTPRQLEMRRLADAMRSVITRLVATGAPEEALAQAADDLERIAAEFEHYPHGSLYEGFAEAANAGGTLSAFFDHSPLIGRANPLAPPISVSVQEPGGVGGSGRRIVVGRARFGAAYEGPPGCVHGGFLAAAFDEVLGATQSLSGRPGMTGTLTIRYRKPTPLHTDLRFEGRLVGIDGRKISTVGHVYANDEMTAEAEGLFISIGEDRFAALKEEREKLAG